MNKSLLLVLLIFFGYCKLSIAQQPALPVKGTLSQVIMGAKSYTNSSSVDTSVLPVAPNIDYTLEVKAKINSASGRGLDIDSRRSTLKGFRLSLDAANLRWSTPLSGTQVLSTSRAGEEQTIRVAVKGESAHIYQNGAFIGTQAISTIKDIVGGAESEEYQNITKGANLVPNWAGTAPNNTGKPSDYGWAYTGSTSTTLFATANSTTAGTVRYMDVNAGSGGNLHTYNGATYVGRVLYLRWDNAAIQNAVFTYPVSLEANTTYDFSMLHAYISNASGNKTMTVGIGKTTATTGRFASQVFTTTGTRVLNRGNFVFTSQEAGTYYITINGVYGLFSVGELSVNKINILPRTIIGKNYPSGAVDIQVSSVSFEEGAYAPDAVASGAKQNLTLTDPVVSVPTTFDTNFILPGKTDLHLTGEFVPFINSSVELNSDEAWLFFDNLRPSEVKANWLDKITINGASALNNPNVRVAIYKNGAVVIPNGNQTSTMALEAFTQTNLSGDSKTFEIETYHNSLGEFNNAIKSFKLKRGYMATLATGADGSGFSRVFIANDADLVINAMPQGLDGTVSFIRVFRWDWISKKGKAGWSPAKIGATWYYDWNIGGGASSDYDYSLIRQNGGWPSFTDINNKKNVNHLLGMNEPDRPDQANMTVDACVAQWPDLMKSGLRVGSPAPANPESSWITDFMSKCNNLNYRVDYVAIHCYWGGQTPQQWYNRLKAIYDRVKRPLWITEWNNGANWTTETWPSDQVAQFEKQYNDMKGILNVLDTASFVERYAIYDWVENKRAMVLADTLTLAGKYYFANKSDFAYNPAKAYTHTWKLVAPTLSSSINSDDYFKTTLTWKDLNGELGSKYTLERKIDGTDADFVVLQEFTDYSSGGNLSYVDNIYSKASYRIKAFNAAGDEFVYSTVIDVVVDAAPAAPGSLTGEVLASSKIKLNWNAGTNARSYNLKRSSSAEGPFDIISSRNTGLTFTDEGLSPATTYFYVVSSLNSAGESSNSTVLELQTPALVTPAGVLNPRIASGDSKITLTWDFIYDAKYEVSRSLNANGTFDVIAPEVDGLRFEDLNRTNGTTYFYKIVAFNATGRSPESNMLQGAPVAGQNTYVAFNENSGTFAEDIWGGYHATFGATATRETGYNGLALKLDGTSTSYASLTSSPLSTLNDFTISTWVNMSALSNWMRIFDFGTGTSKYMFLTAQASATNGVSTIRYAIKNGGSEQAVTFPFTWSLNTWTHFAITQSGSTVNLFINGSLVASNSAVTIKPSDLGLTNQNYIGKSQYSSDPMLKGSIDEFKIFNYAMTEEGVQALAQSVLPVTMLSFTVHRENTGAVLKWTTGSEQNSAYFSIERSSNGIDFMQIGTLKSKGGSGAKYIFSDGVPASGLNYYRLSQTDINGVRKVLGVKDLNMDLRVPSKVTVYPNPVGESFTVVIDSGEANVKVSITDLSGREMYNGSFKRNSAGSYTVPASNLSSGVYILNVNGSTLRLLKQ